jgi:hypothetical protein
VLCGLEEVRQRLLEVLRDALATRVQQGQIELRVREPLARSLLEPLESLLVVQRGSLVKVGSSVALRLRQALMSGLEVQVERGLVVATPPRPCSK